MEKKLPAVFRVMWLCFAAAYLVWMIFFLHWDTYPQNETGIYSAVQYAVWIAFSTCLLLLFPVYMRFFLMQPEHKRDRLISLLLLLVGCGFITLYTFLKNPLDYTASMIGLEYPRCFKLWGILSTSSIFINTLTLFRKYGYRNRGGLIASGVGCAALFVTINVPSAGEDLILNSLRCMSHWTGALMFAFGAAAPVVLFLLHMAKTKSPRWIAAAVYFCGMLAVMLTLLVVVGKDGIIEGIPVWSVYLVLFLTNYTGLFPVPQAADQQRETSRV